MTHQVEFLNTNKTMVKIDGVLYTKSRRKQKSQEEIKAGRERRRAYMKERRLKAKQDIAELKAIKSIAGQEPQEAHLETRVRA
jgi:uncharacterized protein YnzC (UPF0291/DUF896 family)